MEKIKRIFNCKLCDDSLSECILLPCGDSICKNHTKNVQQIRCLSCFSEHEVPSNGFPLNKVANQLIESNFYKLDLGKDFNDAEKICLKLEERLETLSKIIEKPFEFLTEFFEKLILAFDLKREEYKLENHKYAENLINKFDNSNAKKFELFFSYLKLANIEPNQKNLESNSSTLVNEAKNEINQIIDNQYLDLIDELSSKMNVTIDDIEKFDSILDLSFGQEISKIKLEFNLINNEITKLRFMDKDFTKIKKTLKNYLDRVNQIIRYTKNNIVFRKGFDFESKFYHFPYLDNLQFIKENDFEINVESCLISDLEPFKSEKFIVNGIKFNVSLKILINKIGESAYCACLFFENPFQFSAIEIRYSMQLVPYMNAPKTKTSFIKFNPPNYIKLTPIKDLNQFQNLSLYVKVEVLGLRTRC